MSDEKDHEEPASEDGTASEGDHPPRKKMGPRAKLILACVAVAAVVAGVFWWVRYDTRGRYLQETNDARIEADSMTVSPRIAGYVSEVLVEDNQNVAPGQPLLRIDARDAKAQAAQARAQIAVARAQADGVRAQITEQQASISQARAQVAAALTKARYDAGEVARFRPLVTYGAETKQQLAQLEATAKQSADNVRAQSAALQSQVRRVATLQSQVRQGEAQAQAAEAQLSSADVDVSATILKSSIAGRVGDKNVTVGQYVQAGARLMSVVPLDRLYITANFKETQLALMRPGQPVSIKVDALDGTDLKGQVQSIAPGTGAEFSILPPQNATGNFTKITQRVPVRISIEATPATRRLLVAGLSATVTVDTIGAKGDMKQVREQQDQAMQRERSR